MATIQSRGLIIPQYPSADYTPYVDPWTSQQTVQSAPLVSTIEAAGLQPAPTIATYSGTYRTADLASGGSLDGGLPMPMPEDRFMFGQGEFRGLALGSMVSAASAAAEPAQAAPVGAPMAIGETISTWPWWALVLAGFALGWLVMNDGR